MLSSAFFFMPWPPWAHPTHSLSRFAMALSLSFSLSLSHWLSCSPTHYVSFSLSHTLSLPYLSLSLSLSTMTEL